MSGKKAAKVAQKPASKKPKLPKAPKAQKQPKKVRMCGGAPPYAPRGHEPADPDCWENCCAFCCNKRAMADGCPAHGEGDSD